MQNQYSEDQLVEQPAIALLAEMGWETLDCYDEFDQGSSPLGRGNRGEVVLTTRLRAALERLNPDASREAIDGAIEELTYSRATMTRCRSQLRDLQAAKGRRESYNHGSRRRRRNRRNPEGN